LPVVYDSDKSGFDSINYKLAKGGYDTGLTRAKD
jgi:hypothetical protein